MSKDATWNGFSYVVFMGCFSWSSEPSVLSVYVGVFHSAWSYILCRSKVTKHFFARESSCFITVAHTSTINTNTSRWMESFLACNVDVYAKRYHFHLSHYVPWCIFIYLQKNKKISTTNDENKHFLRNLTIPISHISHIPPI